MGHALPWFQPGPPRLTTCGPNGGLVSKLADERRLNHSRYTERAVAVGRFIEEAAGSTDERVTDLIQVSFIGSLHLLGEECRKIVRGPGPRTAKLLADYENNWGKACP